jgi:hypothetical protein
MAKSGGKDKPKKKSNFPFLLFEALRHEEASVDARKAP